VSLTCDFKTFSNKGEQITTIESLGFDKIEASTISGGSTVEESAKIFMDVLNNEATENQKNVVLCNAALAIKTINVNKAFADCFYEAENSLARGNAKTSFKKLIGLNN
jgi:anthranilate phosphoribosyltransferase